jgi:hypothetical protein
LKFGFSSVTVGASSRSLRATERGGNMRRFLMVGLVVVVSLTAIAQTSAATTNFKATIKGEYSGASPESPCPTDPTLDICEVGTVSGFGKVSQVFTFISAEEADGCVEITGDVLWTLISDPESTFMTHEVYVQCTPGASADTPGNRLHSFGNPVTAQGTFVISAGTGVFEGASGSGALFLAGAGDTLVIRYDGTITLP